MDKTVKLLGALTKLFLALGFYFIGLGFFFRGMGSLKHAKESNIPDQNLQIDKNKF